MLTDFGHNTFCCVPKFSVSCLLNNRHPEAQSFELRKRKRHRWQENRFTQQVAYAAFAIYWDAGRNQRVDIAVDSAYRDLERVGDVAGKVEPPVPDDLHDFREALATLHGLL